MIPVKRVLLKEFEGLVLTAYQDVGGVWTIGWGHTGPEVHQGLVWTQQQADAQLVLDLSIFESAVWSYMSRIPTQGQYDAMVDFAYNVGIGAFSQSTLLRKFNVGDIEGAAREFGRWIYAFEGDVMHEEQATLIPAATIQLGLIARRIAEVIVFYS